MTDTTAKTEALIASACKYIHWVATALETIPNAPDPRFTIHYDGNASTGGTAGVDATAARRYLRRDLTSDRLVQRHGLTSVTVRVEVGDTTFDA